MRIRVIDVLDLLAASLNQQKILKGLLGLEIEDIEASINYADGKMDHPVVAT